MNDTNSLEESSRRWQDSLEAAFIFGDALGCHARMVQEIGEQEAERVWHLLGLSWLYKAHRQGWVTP